MCGEVKRSAGRVGAPGGHLPSAGCERIRALHARRRALQHWLPQHRQAGRQALARAGAVHGARPRPTRCRQQLWQLHRRPADVVREQQRGHPAPRAAAGLGAQHAHAHAAHAAGLAGPAAAAPASCGRQGLLHAGCDAGRARHLYGRPRHAGGQRRLVHLQRRVGRPVPGGHGACRQQAAGGGQGSGGRPVRMGSAGSARLLPASCRGPCIMHHARTRLARAAGQGAQQRGRAAPGPAVSGLPAGPPTDDGDHRAARPPRVVQVAQPVGQAGAQVQ
jgi:hypothetical protein